jgi:thiamine transport system ATP-binding protein
MLELAGATVRFGTQVALDGIDLAIADGERLAVLGPSGAGKSTLLRAVAGLEPLAAGRISWQGEDLAPVPVHRRHFGLMFQDYVLFPNRDVAGNVAFGLQMAGVNRANAAGRVSEVLALVGLAGYERRSISALSGGEQQRVALARALAPRPQLLMLDEPLGALDRTLRERLLGELAALFAKLDLTIIYVTHDQAEALAMGDRVAVLHAGRLEAVATPDELWRQPANEFVAGFLGLRNITDATVADGWATTEWGRLPVPAGTPAGRHRLVLRPTGLIVDPSGPICGRVEAATFRGSYTEVIVAVTGATAMVAQLPAGTPAPPAGQPICLGLAARAVVLLPAVNGGSLSR